jgi:ubiquinone/menaquinone biosynthesis C-methylase UbiE
MREGTMAIEARSSPGVAIVRSLVCVLLALPLLAILLHTLVRIVRHFYKFPIPPFLANAIDNPLRRRIQPPDETALRHGLEPGMRVLEVGPGNGTYTLAAARRVGDSGKIVTVDIEPKMIERVERRARREGVENIEAWVANVYDLPFEDGSFDAVYMIAVIGEIPDPERAMSEFSRVLAPAGTLVFSELLMDPDYPWAKTLIRMGVSCGLRLKDRVGNAFYYTLIFEKEQYGSVEA